jgi:KDO2-lipid IV(A) lauroyltransferase
MWQYYLMKALSRFVCVLPDKARRMAGAVLGEAFWLVTPRWRKNLAASQIKACLKVSDAKAQIIAKDSVTKYGAMIVDVLYFPALSKDNIGDKVVFADEEQFKEIVAEPKGFVLATAHFGNWELLGAALGLYGCRLAAVAQKQHNAAMNRFINEYRAMMGEHVIDSKSVLAMARMLERGLVVGLLADQDGGRDGVNVEFFGRASSCPAGPAALARLKELPLRLVLLRKRSDDKHEITISAPIEVKNVANRKTAIKETTATLMKMLEGEIRKNPDMWFWLHNRWKADKKLYKAPEY